jgi:hypothetical protein
MNVVYKHSDFPTNGPIVEWSDILEGPILSLKYDQEIVYNNEELSGFYYCCKLDYYDCDREKNRNWIELDKQLVEFVGSDVIHIKIGELVVCEMEVPHIAYLWRQTPIENYLGAPIYSKDSFSLPSAPWKKFFRSLYKENYFI